MRQLNVSLVSLGHQKQPIDYGYLKNWRSRILKIEHRATIADSPNAKGDRWEYPDTQLRQLVQPVNGADLTVAIVSAPIERNFYSRRLGNNVVAFSIHEMAHILNAANFRIEHFILRNIYQLSIYFQALNGQVNPHDWPEWEQKIGPGQESRVWFVTGRRKPEDIHAGLPAVVLGTNRMGVLATGETVSAAEFRADPDAADAKDPSGKAWLEQPQNRVCIQLKGLATPVPIQDIEENPDTARLPAARETITWLKSHEHAALTSLVQRHNS